MRYLTSILLCLATWANAQSVRTTPYYTPNEGSIRQKEIEKAKASVPKYFVRPTDFDKEATKQYNDQCAELSAELEAIIQEEALFDDVLWPFVQQVHAQIVRNNPDLMPTQIILTGSPIPNAFSMGNGTIVVFTGLLSELENEDELAFVLCHEIAHFELYHAPNLLKENIAYFHSKEFKEQIKKLQNTEYNRSEKLEELVLTTQFKSRFHRRDKERQADSLAYHYYKKTGYSPQHALHLMELFEHIDKISMDSLALERHLGCGGFPYQKKWSQVATTSVWGEAIAAKKEQQQQLEDSLSTHPDSKLRLQWLENLMDMPLKPSEGNIEPAYAPIRQLSAIENVNSFLRAERYDRAMYRAILYQKRYPEVPFFQDALLLSLNGMYRHLKAHDLHSVVATTSPYYSERFNTLLTVLNNLRVSELQSLQTCLVTTPDATDREYALYGGYLYMQDKGDKQQTFAYKRRYLSLFPRGRFAAAIKGLTEEKED